MVAQVTERHVVQGYDVVTTLTAPVLGSTAAGTNAQPVMTGKYEEVSFTLAHDIERYLETEEQIAQILTGEFTIEGSLRRGWQSIDIIQRIMPNLTAGIVRGQRSIVPKFTISMTINAPEKVTLHGKGVTLVDCTFMNLDVTIAAGKGVSRKTIRFAAEGIMGATGAIS